jgi:hypothetical protein
MRTGQVSVSLLALLVLTAGTAGADAVKLPPDIRQATVDNAAETLLLDGDFACKGGQLLAVQLSGTPLAVLSVSNTQVLAQLPAGAPSGSYRVRVDCGPAKSDVFEVTIGAAGPKGEPGPAGPQGPMGDTGPMGLTGPAGAIGPQGPAGPAGAIGPQGPAGPAGATGAQGPAGAVGAAGPQGPAGLTGAQGAPGPAGPPGLPGPVGPAGPAGATGPAGPGFRWRGAFDPLGPAYTANDVVQNGGKSWAAASAVPKECVVYSLNGTCYEYGPDWAAPETPQGTAWQLFASGGVGPQGPQGPQGSPGLPGPPGLAGPAGPAGPQGPPGPTGLATALGSLQFVQTRVPGCTGSTQGFFCPGVQLNSLALPAGTFLVTAHVEGYSTASAAFQDNQRELECWLNDLDRLPGYQGLIRVWLPPPHADGQIHYDIAVQGSWTWVIAGNSPQTVSLSCRVPLPWRFPTETETNVEVVTRRLVAVPIASFAGN